MGYDILAGQGFSHRRPDRFVPVGQREIVLRVVVQGADNPFPCRGEISNADKCVLFVGLGQAVGKRAQVPDFAGLDEGG